MVFKRKNKQTTLKYLKSLFFPEGGWRRAIEYLSHRIKRLPDSPHKIALGLSFGVFASFSPLFGFHFLLGAVFAYLFNANVFASIIGTFFANPITFPFIAAISVRTGSFILDQFSIVDNDMNKADTWVSDSELRSLGIFEKFLVEVYFDKFIPYAVGGVICGIITAFFIYILSKPLIDSYQKRKRKRKRKSNKINTKI
tara:strand:- start:193 stop:786 length:594 start_codon:yes stop_codon:yes gene_type:complete